MSKAWSQTVVLLGDLEPLRDGPSGRSLGHWDDALMGLLDIRFLPLSLLPGSCEVSSPALPHVPTVVFCSTTSPQQCGQVTMS